MDPDPAIIALTTILLALDIIQTRPSDPAYSEYQGLTSIMYYLLLDGILTLKVGDQYAAVLRTFLFLLG